MPHVRGADPDGRGRGQRRQRLLRRNPIPAFGQATTSLLPPSDGFFTKAAYRGAFEPGGESWLPRWSMARTMGTDKTTFDCKGDLNGDYIVNSADFSTFVGRFGSNCN